MNSGEMFPEHTESHSADSFLRHVYPDAVAIIPVAIDDEVVQQRLKSAGLSFAEVLKPDGESEYATYLTAETHYTKALELIYLSEVAQMIPAGSHDSAIDAIILGEFEEYWAAYLPGQKH